MSELDVTAIAAQIACRLLGDYEPQDRDADADLARHAVRLARLLMQEVARTDKEDPKTVLREVERS